jgi:hypothetical protein
MNGAKQWQRPGKEERLPQLSRNEPAVRVRALQHGILLRVVTSEAQAAQLQQIGGVPFGNKRQSLQLAHTDPDSRAMRRREK